MTDLRVRHRSDIIAILLLLALFALLLVDDILIPAEYAFSDFVSFFTPMYALLGHGLREFDLYGWNPFQFSGSPFAADPESGWMYLPVMIIFTLLPPGAAPYLLHAFVHLALAGIGGYVFARMLGLNPIGAFAAAVASVLPQLAHHLTCCPPLGQVPAWIPWMLIGAERSLRATDWRARFGGWAITAFAISQVIAAWPGQGMYNALLMLAAWLAWRTFFVAAAQDRSLPARLARTTLDGAAMLLLGLGISAAGLLPRLAFNAVSNVPGGVYLDDSGHFAIGWSAANLVTIFLSGFLSGLRWYPGAAVLVLVLIAPVVARRWNHTPFFVAAALIPILLTLGTDTPVHHLFYAVLPKFELMHTHAPERILILTALPIGMLAGATITWLPRWSGSRRTLIAVSALPLVALVLIRILSGGPEPAISTRTIIIAAAATILLVIAALVLPEKPSDRGGSASALPLALRIVPVSLIALIAWDPAGITLANHLGRAHLGYEALSDLDEYVRRTPAASFIADATADDPGRYFGFSPDRLPPLGEITWGYLRRSDDPNGVLVNNRATAIGIDDVQGYNPVHLWRYVEYIDALNGYPQDYHETSVLVSGLDSPMLDMLNARYVIVPREIRPGFAKLLPDDLPIVFEDEFVNVLERDTAFPRAWLVHDARQLPRGEALPLLASGAVDPRQTALLETDPPALAPPPTGATESARYTHREPDRLDLRVDAAAPALVVLSEIYDEGWSATIDGEPVPVLLANHTLLAVPVPAGEHDLVLRYDPPGLRLGIAITLATVAGMVVAGLLLERRRRSGAHSPEAA